MAPHDLSPFTRLLMDQLQIAALLFMATMYALKVRWLLRFPAARERTPARGDESRAIRYAYLTLAMPWEMESTRRQWLRYAEFVLFHLGAAICIFATFVLPYWPHLIAGQVAIAVMRAVVVLALAAGLIRLARRIAVPHLRLISSPDDYFSLALLNLWLVSAFFAVGQGSEGWFIAFFGSTAFFLVYVPFSKISHYLLWPFIRYYQGKHFGHRGVFPKKTVAERVTTGAPSAVAR